MTTNALLLERHARELRDAGLRRVNVSLDTLDPARFRQIARRDRFADVMAGLEAAERVGLGPIKINAVLMRGFNEDEAVPLAGWARERGYELRFIEWMPLDFQRGWSRERLVRAAELVDALHAAFPLEPAPGEDPPPRRRCTATSTAAGGVGVIASVTRPFCGHCDRIRLTADGNHPLH